MAETGERTKYASDEGARTDVGEATETMCSVPYCMECHSGACAALLYVASCVALRRLQQTDVVILGGYTVPAASFVAIDNETSFFTVRPGQACTHAHTRTKHALRISKLPNALARQPHARSTGLASYANRSLPHGCASSAA